MGKSIHRDRQQSIVVREPSSSTLSYSGKEKQKAKKEKIIDGIFHY
jgi:hypothetical protein